MRGDAIYREFQTNVDSVLTQGARQIDDRWHPFTLKGIFLQLHVANISKNANDAQPMLLNCSKSRSAVFDYYHSLSSHL